MALNPTLREEERERIARHVLELVKERGSEIAWTVAMAESGLTRTRFEALFADYDDLFDAVVCILDVVVVRRLYHVFSCK